MDQFPPNSDKSKAAKQPKAPKKVERVVEGDVTRRSKPLGTRFRETFIGGDAKTAADYALFNVMIPAAKDALADAFSQGMERLIFGESRGGTRRRSMSTPPGGATGHVAYNRFGARPSERDERRSMSRRAREHHDFAEIVIENRFEADNALERMFDLIDQYGAASVADLYTLLGLDHTPQDQKWGWLSLGGARVSRTRRGDFLLDLPDPDPLD